MAANKSIVKQVMNTKTSDYQAVETMVASQCGNDRPGFGLLSVSQKLRAYNIIRVLNILKFKF
jgi:hypothetical protein